MKKILLLPLATCTLLSLSVNANASPGNTKRQRAQVAWMAPAKDTHGKLPCIEQRKREPDRMIQQDEETFRSIQERTLVNPG